MAKVIQGSPDSRVRRNGESPVVKASVEMEEQMVNLEGRSVTSQVPQPTFGSGSGRGTWLGLTLLCHEVLLSYEYKKED